MKKRLTLLFACLAVLILGCSTFAYAAGYSGAAVIQGLRGIVGADTLELPNNTVKADLTAHWGVRVIYQDYDGTELQSTLTEVSDEKPEFEVTSPADPSRYGYTFLKWERVDANAGSGQTEVEKGGVTVSGLSGPGPIIYKAVYEKDMLPTYTVEYVVNGDATNGIPAGGEAPEDVNSPYAANSKVTVLLSPTTVWTTKDGTPDGIGGTWTFSGWDRTDFVITEDTTITGSWTFTPDTTDDSTEESTEESTEKSEEETRETSSEETSPEESESETEGTQDDTSDQTTLETSENETEGSETSESIPDREKAPITGDRSRPMLWAALMALCVCGVMGLVYWKKKHTS